MARHLERFAVWPDGVVCSTSEIDEFMRGGKSDDYAIVMAEDEDDAYDRAVGAGIV